MPRPDVIGPQLYKKIWGKYDNNWGASVVCVVGGQGSAKTACCLDLAEKKLSEHPKEKIFWHDTVGSPCQFMKVKKYPWRIFVEEGVDIEFYNITKLKPEYPQITFFSDIESLFHLAQYKTINVVYFKSRKSWVAYNKKKYGCSQDDETEKQGLIEFLMNGNVAAGEWQTIFIDEMESLFPPDVNNRTIDKWWDWTVVTSPHFIKECRKSRVGLVGNYHKHSSIHHRISEKLMFHIWGLGSIPKNTRVNQSMVDQCNRGEFCIDHDGAKFGKIEILTVYNPPSEEWVVRYK